jgi:8-oxo-dGTP pyrophosphatase MutT (NUDIX family)
MSTARENVVPKSSGGIPHVLFAAVSGKDLARALRRGRLRLKKQRALRLYATREQAAGSTVVRIDALGAAAAGVRFTPEADGYSTEGVPLRFLSCSHAPDSPHGIRLVEAAGGVVVKEGAEPRVLVLRKRGAKKGAWVLPKGKRRPKEDETATAIREVVEETGLERVVVERFLTRERYFDMGKRTCEFKNVAYYLMRCPADEARPRVRRKEGFTDARWMTLAEALDATIPLRAHRALRKAIEFLAGDLREKKREGATRRRGRRSAKRATRAD